MFAADHLSQTFAMQLLAVTPGSATMQLAVTQAMVNGHGICHGGVVFSLADSASAYAANSWGPDAVLALASIEYLSPAREGDALTAVAQETNRVGRKAVIDVTVTTSEGRLIAVFRGHTTQPRNLSG